MWPSQRLASIGLDSQQRKSQARSRNRRGIKPIVTLLEERTLLSTVPITVTSLADSGTGTLRAAITTVDSGSDSNQYAISFASGLTGTINLTEALPNLSNNISITGPGASSLNVNRVATAADFNVFTVQIAKTVNISNITIMDNYSGSYNYSGISNGGTLTVNNTIFTDNSNSINNGGTLTVNNTIFTNNGISGTATGGIENIATGGIINDGTLTVTNSTFTDNTGRSIWNNGTATVSDSTFIGNSGTIERCAKN